MGSPAAQESKASETTIGTTVLESTSSRRAHVSFSVRRHSVGRGSSVPQTHSRRCVECRFGKVERIE